MNVLLVTSSYPKFPGDVTAPFIESIARGVADRGHRVDVVLPHHPELRRGTGEPVRFFPYRYVPGGTPASTKTVRVGGVEPTWVNASPARAR